MIKYIDRDKNGKICGLYANQQRKGQESIDDSSPEVQEFLSPVPLKSKEIERLEALESGLKKVDPTFTPKV